METDNLIKYLEKIHKHLQKTIDVFPLLAVHKDMRTAFETLVKLAEDLKNERALK